MQILRHSCFFEGRNGKHVFFLQISGLYYDEYGFLKGQNASSPNSEDDALLTKAKSFDMYSRDLQVTLRCLTSCSCVYQSPKLNFALLESNLATVLSDSMRNQGGGNKIKGFGDGEQNQKLEKKKKEKF